ncbi:MAG: nucleotidyltransferase domain-containing protein [Bradymonadales bacterium]|nr:MAG: nucleotidyltransferase domain-containing protein [Bradymonadales bacterium]
MKFGLTDKELKQLQNKVIQPLRDRGARVWVFGSRARGDHKKFSDLDILFEVPIDRELEPGFLFEIKSEMEDSNFPYKVDLVDSKSLAESYRAGVEAERVEA